MSKDRLGLKLGRIISINEASSFIPLQKILNSKINEYGTELKENSILLSVLILFTLIFLFKDASSRFWIETRAKVPLGRIFTFPVLMSWAFKNSKLSDFSLEVYIIGIFLVIRFLFSSI